MVDELFKIHYPNPYNYPSFSEFIIIFKSDNELVNFEKYMHRNINLLTDGSIVYPANILQTNYNLDDNQNQQYIIAKTIKFIYNNSFLKN